MIKKGKSTHCVHTGNIIDKNTGGMVTPVYPSTAYDYLEREVIYPRYFNTPNQKAVCEKIAALEGGESSLITSSGMAAITTIMFSLLRTGDHAIFQSGIYGGTHHAIINELEKFGVEYSFIEEVSEEAIAEVKKDNSRIIYFETPTNPLLEITDLELAGALSKQFGLTSIVDNTFASPVNQNPIQFGIDAVIHSGTKYLGGHSDLSCGAIISSQEMIEKCWNSAIHFGGNLNAFSVYLLERSLKTLSIRVENQNSNALQLAMFLEGLPQVKKVNYPGLESNTGHTIAKRQMSGFGGMMSFELDLNENQIDRFLKHLNVLHPSISLGGVETIISSPALTSHAKMSEEERRKIGITNQLLRLSVGIENIEDLTQDIESALEKVDVLV